MQYTTDEIVFWDKWVQLLPLYGTLKKSFDGRLSRYKKYGLKAARRAPQFSKR